MQGIEWISVDRGMPIEAETKRRLQGAACSDPVLVTLQSSYNTERRVATDVTYNGKWLTYGRGEWRVTHWAEMPPPAGEE